MQIKDILQYKQPYVLRKLNIDFKKEKQPEVEPERFSFNYLDKIMREKSDVDERKCTGR